MSSTSKFKATEKEEKILKCFEMAGDLSLLYLQVSTLVVFLVLVLTKYKVNSSQ